MAMARAFKNNHQDITESRLAAKDILSKIENLEYYLGSKKSSVISRDLRNGILSPSESGFKINLTNNETSRFLEYE